MKLIRKRMEYTVLIVIIALIATIYFVVSAKMIGIITCGAVTVIFTIVLGTIHFTYRDAKLIYDNQILIIPQTTISFTQEGEGKTVTETIISTFGVMTDNKIITWGKDGRNGINVREITLDQKYITIFFGYKEQKSWIKLLHGLTDPQKIEEVKNKLLYETGVKIKAVS